MKKKELFRIGFLLFALVFTLALFNGRGNYNEALFMCHSSTNLTDGEIAQQMAVYGFSYEWFNEPSILDYCYSGLFY